MLSTRMSATLAALVLVIAFTVSGTGAFQCSSFANGCSTPLNMDVWYKKEFTPACNIHDVCYRCVRQTTIFDDSHNKHLIGFWFEQGARWGISRARCDSVFRSDMLSVCPRQRNPLACSVVANTYHGVVVLAGAPRYRARGNTPSERMKTDTTRAILLVVGVAFAVQGEIIEQDTSDGQCSADANGCSIPFNINVFFKEEFTPACNIHDVCYRCGARYSISRDRCDSVFLSQMQSVCPRQQQSDLCLTVSRLYYEAVKHLGFLRYHLSWFTPSECSNPDIRLSCLQNH
ncbi:hypothetical protein C0Q70_19480 [Pomacea canaliculata]|uniref:Conodipine-M alpha chain n=1 Tax=Pomacea canaliculata TaxID=400727 RepID=A0A2T7NJH0_POMCA|nr:hypothetical protein C0Q70_19480 [Pomacea canaliculata]